MNEHLEELKRLVNSGEFDAESQQYVKDLEDRFQKAVLDARLLTIPSVIEYVQHLKDEVARIKEMLSEQTLKLTEQQRVQLHERKECCRDFLNYFEPVRTAENTIKQTLNAFNGKKDIYEGSELV